MAVNAIVKDGQLVETAAQSSASSAAGKSAGTSATKGYDKDAFLQLLVAQMKYQDPLEPTDNSQYITQYATFSQVEQIQNMAASTELSRASGMVGKSVEVTTEDANGAEKIIEGVVEFVKYENNKAYVSIDGELYAASDVTAVIDDNYSNAFALANAFANSMNSLPSLSELTLGDEETIETLRAGYNALTPYQQSFIDSSYTDMLKKYVERMAEMKEDSEKSKSARETTETTEEDKEAEETVAETDGDI
ncbi:MAG: flagellar hook capping protein [Lachnospiraceae bacterium]|nr:flagellar hook capping protein [Lachnospiraceae bacterium]